MKRFLFLQYSIKCHSHYIPAHLFDHTQNFLAINSYVSSCNRNFEYIEKKDSEKEDNLGKEPNIRHPIINRHFMCVDSKAYSSLLQGCAKTRALAEGKTIHARIVKIGLKQELFLQNHLINMYGKCGSLENARQVFDKMAKRNVVSFTALIAGYTQDGRGADALNLFSQMQSEAIRGNCVTFVSVLKACGIVGDLQVGRQVHRHFFEAGFESNIIVGSSLVDMYAKCGGIEDARNVFDKMPEHNTVSLTAMVAGYAQWGNLDEALELFDQMSVRDTVSWNAMIVGLTKNDQSDKATKVFFRMQSSGMKADRITFASVLRACANLAVLQHGKQIHSHIVKTGFEMDLIVGSALVDMYAKCGSIENAMEVFDKMSERNVVSWTAMIAACSQHGRGKDALQLFEKMQEADVKANEITYVSLLSACSHAGLVDEGRHFFNSMGEVHGITPKVEHYSCMVDLLGRAGFLDEAEEFIRGMPVEPNLAVWGALLGACRIHGNIQLGGRVAEQLLQLKVQDNATYVLLSNTYAALGRWDGVAKVRKLMKNKGLKKQPGCSWIEVKSGLHVFISGDKSHPHKEEIYAMLDKLAKEIKQAGYVPGTNAVLLDVEEEQRELLLWCHSEKLAIAFGIISTPPRTTIRVMKNLRVCVDCHTAIKFISNTVQREIVVRDANRFHHFKDGQCSCGNYW